MPDLMTPRLLLKPYEASDIDDLHALWTEPAVRKFLWDDVVIPRETAEEVIRESIASHRTLGLGQWTVRLRGEPPLIGFCGFRNVDSHVPELLFGFSRRGWKKGYATEASIAALVFAFDHRHVPRVVASTDPPNTASVRVLGRLGMRRDISKGNGPLPLFAFSLNAGDFRKPDFTLVYSKNETMM